jgi:hypothetical protein
MSKILIPGSTGTPGNSPIYGDSGANPTMAVRRAGGAPAIEITFEGGACLVPTQFEALTMHEMLWWASASTAL